MQQSTIPTQQSIPLDASLSLDRSIPLDRQRAFLTLFRERTYNAVWNWLRRLGVPRRDRRDIAQEVFLAGYQSFPSYDPLRARPERWLNRITVHVAAHYRDRAHHRREELTAEEHATVADERPSADEQIDAEETRALVVERLLELQGDEKTILVEHDLEGTPMADIAARRGIPLSTAYKWRARALASLRALMEEPRADGTRRRPQLSKGYAARRTAASQPPPRTAAARAAAALARPAASPARAPDRGEAPGVAAQVVSAHADAVATCV